MFTYNNEHLFTGYIKQILADFNLPNYKVYTKEDEIYHNLAVEHNQTAIPEDQWPLEAPDIISSIVDTANTKTNSRSIGYIKNNTIQYYINNTWVPSNKIYYYNKKELNCTKNLSVKNNSYDSYTHEYLGNYLRFQRDYNNIDLMPLYNCFSNVICQNVNFSITNKANKTLSVFNTSDKQYKIYMVPVKLFKKYTIAIDSILPVEICCSIFSDYYSDSPTITDLQNNTYTKYNSLSFSSPVIFDKLYVKNAYEKEIAGSDNKKSAIDKITDNIELFNLIQCEQDLKMFIKLPISNSSSITILEGDYSGFNQITVKKTDVNPDDLDKQLYWKEITNRFVTNYETSTIGQVPLYDLTAGSDEEEEVYIYKLPEVADRNFIPYAKLQLLVANTTVSHPFADRLVEYLLDNTISQVDKINDNVKRAQTVLNLNGNNVNTDGLWNNMYRNIFYDYMLTPEINYSNIIKHNAGQDCLGYIDKDVEKYYTAWSVSYRLDKDGKPIQKVDEYGNPIFTKPDVFIGAGENSRNVIIADRLQRGLQIKQDEDEETTYKIPVYETVVNQVATISNIDIYQDLYKDLSNKE